MKKLATLLLAAGLVFGMSTGASAIDFKAKGLWIMAFDYGQNGGFTGGNGQTGYARNGIGSGEDEFEARQRVRLQLDAVASESLSGTVFFEINNTWGRHDTGGALGADQTDRIALKNAYLDWVVPETDLKVRMGIQGMALPSFTTGSNVFNDDVAGIVLSYKFNDNAALTALWARPFNDNYNSTYYTSISSYRTNYMDNVDTVALILPLTFDGVKVTPWGMYTAIGPNATIGDLTKLSKLASSGYIVPGMLPAFGALHKDGTAVTKRLDSYGDAWWAGLTGEVTTFDPFRIAWDFNYGSVAYDDGHYDRKGWLASLLFEYKLDWGIPGLYGWYASGDDNDPSNGSERMPSFSNSNNNNGFASFAFNGNPLIGERDRVLSTNMTGTWGIGARLKNVSFVEDLKHTLRLNYIGGTNNTTMAKKYMTGTHGGLYNASSTRVSGPIGGPAAGLDPLYLTTQDGAVEIGLTTEYQMYENFKIYMDASYIATILDQSSSVWGNSHMNGASDQVRDPWNINLNFVYSF